MSINFKMPDVMILSKFVFSHTKKEVLFWIASLMNTAPK